MFEQSADTVMSDDTDTAPVPYSYDSIIQTWHQYPERLFYGTVYVENGDPERGIAQWMPWSERWIVLLMSPFFALEQLSTALVFALLMINFLAMYLLARYLKWNPWVAFGLSLAWAFNPFTRARAKVHMAMTGTYHLPLIFLGLYLLARGRGWRSAFAAAAAFLLAMTTVHYFIVTALFLSPLFLFFLFLQTETQQAIKENWRMFAMRLCVAFLPAICFLAWNYKFTVPSGVKMAAQDSYPKSGQTADGQTHPFLTYYAAKPIDYLTGDLSLVLNFAANPLVESLTQHVQNTMDSGNYHERSNGIRWVLIALAIFSVANLIRGKYSMSEPIGRNTLYFLILGTVAFWLSLSPDSPFPGWGPSGWLQSIVSQIRVPSRAGIIVHFSVLMIAGYLLNRQRKWILSAAVFPVLLFAEYPPLARQVPMAAVRPAYTELQREKGSCGAGMYFPFVSFYAEVQRYYNLYQQMRGSDCLILNGMSTHQRLFVMINKFPPAAEFIQTLSRRPEVQHDLAKLAECVPLTWIAFAPEIPVQWTAETCAKLGWKLNSDLTCVRPEKNLPLKKMPDECF